MQHWIKEREAFIGKLFIMAKNALFVAFAGRSSILKSLSYHILLKKMLLVKDFIQLDVNLARRIAQNIFVMKFQAL